MSSRDEKSLISMAVVLFIVIGLAIYRHFTLGLDEVFWIRIISLVYGWHFIVGFINKTNMVIPQFTAEYKKEYIVQRVLFFISGFFMVGYGLEYLYNWLWVVA